MTKLDHDIRTSSANLDDPRNSRVSSLEASQKAAERVRYSLHTKTTTVDKSRTVHTGLIFNILTLRTVIEEIDGL